MRVKLFYRRAPWISTHVLPSFARLHCDVELYDVRDALPGTTLWHEIGAVISGASSGDILFFIEGTDTTCAQDSLKTAKDRGARLINYLVDVPQDWWRSLAVCRLSDLVLVAQRENAERLRPRQGTLAHFNFAISEDFSANTGAHRNATSERAVFLGSAHSDWRWQFLQYLDRQGLALDVIGGGWNGHASVARTPVKQLMRYPLANNVARLASPSLVDVLGAIVSRTRGVKRTAWRNMAFLGPLPDREMRARLHSASAIVSTSVHGSSYRLGLPKRQFKLRDIELASLGTPYIMQKSAGINDAYDAGYPFTYDHPSDVAEIYSRIRSAPARARDAAFSITADIRRKHTWRQRFEELSELTGLDWR